MVGKFDGESNLMYCIISFCKFQVAVAIRALQLATVLHLNFFWTTTGTV